MRTARFSGSGGTVSSRQTPPLPKQTSPLEADPLHIDRPFLEGTWDQTARQEVTSYPPVDRQTGVKTLHYLVPTSDSG